MSKCGACDEKFPSRLLSPLVTPKGVTSPICPICALSITNEIHGIDRTEFTGTMAQEMLEEAQEIMRKRGKL